MSDGWIRVTKKSPCPVCKKPDWCTVHPTIGVCCMRVQSSRPMKNDGWLHKHHEDLSLRKLPPKPPEPDDPPPDFELVMKRYMRQTYAEDLEGLARTLKVSLSSIVALEVLWSQFDRAFAFPMKNEFGNMIGIRLRSRDGQKWSVKGSKQGVFIPMSKPDKTLYICEGPTDTAACLDLGRFAIGRPSAKGGDEIIVRFVRINRFSRVVIVSDNDKVGTDGSMALQERLTVPSCVMVLPCKDVRDFVQMGGNTATLDSIQKSMVWKSPCQTSAATG